MTKEKFLQILDKNIDQEQLMKDMVSEFAKPVLEELLGKVISGAVDIIPGTDLDKEILVKAIHLLIEKTA